MVGFLLKQGLVLVREGGRHTIPRGPTGELAVPRHSGLKVGTFAAILKQSGVARAKWPDL
jgi:predicted RNA binding protein YcfA (HicA-like mRNA interferase family)